MEISTGRPESHPTPLPLDTSSTPTLAPWTPVAGQQTSADQGGVMDATAMFAEQAQAGTDAAAAAMSAGMSAEQDRRSGYHADMLPAGASYGDEMALPAVPAYATVAGDSGDYPWQGDEPTPAG